MMKRRTFILGLGTAAGGLAVGTGAFTSVTAERDVEVSVVEDDGAFLSINPLATADNPNGEYAKVDDTTGEFYLQLTGTEAGGSGLSPEAVTDAADVFEVKNQGTQDVDLTVTPTNAPGADNDVSGSILYLDGGDLAGSSGNQKVLLGVFPKDEVATEPISLSPGDSVTYGLVAVVGSNVGGADTALDDDQLQFIAEAGDQ